MSHRYVAAAKSFHEKARGIAHKAENELRNLHQELTRLDRDASLYPAERERRQYEARQASQMTLNTLVKELDSEVATLRSEVTYRPSAPDADEIRLRTYYRQQAIDELAGLSAAEQLMVVRQIITLGDAKRSQEYLSVAKGPARTSGLSGDLRALERQVEPVDAKVSRALSTSIDAFEFAPMTSLRDTIDRIVPQVGYVPDEVKQGLAIDPGPDMRALELWAPSAEKRMTSAFETAFTREATGSEAPDAGQEG